MPKVFYQWEVVVSRTVYNRDIPLDYREQRSVDENGWPWSHNFSRSVYVYDTSKFNAKEKVIPTLEPEKVIDTSSTGIHVTSEFISNVYCNGEVRRVTKWEIVDRNAHPHWSKM